MFQAIMEKEIMSKNMEKKFIDYNKTGQNIKKSPAVVVVAPCCRKKKKNMLSNFDDIVLNINYQHNLVM